MGGTLFVARAQAQLIAVGKSTCHRIVSPFPSVEERCSPSVLSHKVNLFPRTTSHPVARNIPPGGEGPHFGARSPRIKSVDGIAKGPSKRIAALVYSSNVGVTAF
jgi:hypothetical protein